MKHNPDSVQTAEIVIGSLLAMGVQDFAYCPGSRNAPFAYVLSAWEKAGRLRVHPFVEERGAGFWAVGAAKAQGGSVPVAVVVTSGTAVAELHPALEEARFQELPVLVLSADRPFELLGVGASQATTQVGLFGSTVAETLDIPAGSADGVAGRIPRYLASMLGFSGRPGPGHINVGFRDPLVPGAAGWRVGEGDFRPHIPDIHFPDPPSGTSWDKVVEPGLNTVVIAGDALARERSRNLRVGQAAVRRSLPIVAEPTSGLTELATWIPHGPWMLDLLGERVQQAIVLGRPTLSRSVSRLLARPDVRVVLVSDRAAWPDPTSNADVIVPAISDPAAQVGDPDEGDSAWLSLWRAVSLAMSSSLEHTWGHAPTVGDGVQELEAAAMIWRDRATDLWLGASNTIRSFDLVAGGPGRSEVFSNRGLAGIDGTVATALGFQNKRNRPLRVVLGDLTFCYDLPSLPSRPDGVQDLQLIVFDDGGGRIFEGLEYGEAADAHTLERFFVVPQQIDIVGAAQACGWVGVEVNSLPQLRDVLSQEVLGRSVANVKTIPPAHSFVEARTAALDAGRKALT